MESKIQDRRIRKTKKLLKDGLSELMVQKSINEISVKELTDAVDLNRGTFYLHYKDIFDMVEQIEDEMLEDFTNVIASYSLEVLNGSPFLLLEGAFSYLKENATIATALMSSHGDIAFVNKLKEVVRDKCFYDWSIMFNDNHTDKYNYLYSFIISGCLGLFDLWLNNNLVESPKEMAKLAEDIILNGINLIR